MLPSLSRLKIALLIPHTLVSTYQSPWLHIQILHALLRCSVISRFEHDFLAPRYERILSGRFLFVRTPALRLLWFSSVLPRNSLLFCSAVAFKPFKIEVLQGAKWRSRYTGLRAVLQRNHVLIPGNDKRFISPPKLPNILWGSPTPRLSRYGGSFSGSTAMRHDPTKCWG